MAVQKLRGLEANKPTLLGGQMYVATDTGRLYIGRENDDDIIIADDSSSLGNIIYWEDMRIPATAINPPGLPADPTYDATNMGWAFAVNDQLQIIAQMSHSWVEGTTIYPHVHFKQTTSAQVNWSISYRVYNNGDDIGSLGFTTLAIDSPIFPWSTSYTELAQIQGTADGIDMTGKKISSIIEIKLDRLSDSGPTDVVMTDFDLHYQRNTLGSTEEFDK